MAVKDLSAHMLDPDDDYVYDPGVFTVFEQPEMSCCREKIPSVVSCDNEITAFQRI